MASQEHSRIGARSLGLKKASYELQIPKSATFIFSFSLRCWLEKDLLLSHEKVLSVHI